MNSYEFVNCAEISKVKAKDSEVNAAPFFWSNFRKDFSVNAMKNIRYSEYVFYFSVDYDIIDVADVLDIHKNLIKMHDIK